MNYRVTEHYLRAEETLIAEFDALSDAIIFMTAKRAYDNKKRMTLIYRLYEDAFLIEEFNPGQISVAYSQYADGNADISHATQFDVNIMFQPESNTDKTNIANFNDKQDASLFLFGKCKTDKIVNDGDLFFILKETYVIDTLNKVIVANRSKNSAALGEQNLSAVFYPHPMQMTLKPPGFPRDIWIEEELWVTPKVS